MDTLWTIVKAIFIAGIIVGLVVFYATWMISRRDK